LAAATLSATGAEVNIADISVTECLFRRDPGARASRAA